MKEKIIILSVFLILFVFNNCKSEDNMDNNNDSRIKYYSTFAGYGAPIKPQDEIGKDEALKKTSYYIGYYNDHGQLIKFEKYLDKKLFFIYEYEYYDNGKIKKVITNNAEDKKIIIQFDEKGKEL